MQILYHTFGLQDQTQFEPILEKLDGKDLRPITKIIGSGFNKSNKKPLSFGPININDKSSDLSFNRIMSQIFVASNGLIIVELEKTSPKIGSIFTLGLANANAQVRMRATAVCETLLDCDNLLCQVGTAYNKIAGGMFPTDYGAGTNFFSNASKEDFKGYLKNLKETTSYEDPSYSTEETELSFKLKEESFRSFALRLAQLPNMTDDQLNEQSKAISFDTDLKNYLISRELIRTENVIVCKKDNKRIATIVPEEDGPPNLNIRCANCNRAFRDERIVEGNAMTDKFRGSLTKSRWMNIYVTEKLMKLGASRDLIAWNVIFGADEIDIVAKINGLIWIFELKDIEFSYANAQTFNHRRSIIDPWMSVIFTTKHISQDAKDVFSSTERRGKSLLGDRGGMRPPLYIEGVDQFDNVIRPEIDASSQAQARWNIRRALQGLDDFTSELLMARI